MNLTKDQIIKIANMTPTRRTDYYAQVSREYGSDAKKEVQSQVSEYQQEQRALKNEVH